MKYFLKSATLCLALTIGAVAFSSAQQPQTDGAPLLTYVDLQAMSAPAAPAHQANPDHQAKELTKKLNLSADQTAQIEPILADRDQRIATLNADTVLAPKTMHQQRKAIMADIDQKLNAILTPAQQQQWATLKAQHKQPKPATSPAPSL